MNAPFDLPDGLSWGELTDHDRRWLEGNGEGSIPMARGVPTAQHAHLDITMTLRRRSTGEERVYTDDWYPFLPTTKDDLLRGVLFQWTEGNFSCNCNRALFWARTGGEPEPDDTTCDMGDDGFDIVEPGWLAKADRGEEPFEWCDECGSEYCSSEACALSRKGICSDCRKSFMEGNDRCACD